MKKIVLVLMALSFLFTGNAFGRKKNSLDTKPKLNNLRLYVSVLPGFEAYKIDSSNVTVAIPVGINYRYYPSDHSVCFIDADASFMPIILLGNKFTSYMKLSVGNGWILSKSNYNIQFHGNYAHSFVYKKGDMFGLGYDVDAQSIPISVDVYKFINNSNLLILVGIKVPLFDLGF